MLSSFAELTWPGNETSADAGTVLSRLAQTVPVNHLLWILLVWVGDADWVAFDEGRGRLSSAVRTLQSSAQTTARELTHTGCSAVAGSFGRHGIALYLALAPEQPPQEIATSVGERLVRALPAAHTHLQFGLAGAGALGQATPASLRRAMQLAYTNGARGAGDFGRTRLEIHALLQSRDVRVLYQPIVSLGDGAIFGHEALTRGPAGSPLEYPDRLFPAAEREGLSLSLERVCRELALQGYAEATSHGRLFLNVNPTILLDEAFRGGLTLKLVRQLKLHPSQVVFEITERQAVTDYRVFRQALEHYRHQGFLIAVDDAGAGYSSLQSISELRPDIIKIDMSIVHGIDRSAVKRALFDALAKVAQTIGAKVVAEGIETNAELAAVIRLGGHLGQGYFLGRPGRINVPVAPEVQRALKSVRRPRTVWGRLTLGDVVRENPILPAGATGREAAALFEGDELIDGIAVVEGSAVVGLVMRDKFFRALGQLYGVALWHDRPLSSVMDGHPLILDLSTTLEETAVMVTARLPNQLYDHVVVTRDSSYLGVVSIRLLLEAISGGFSRESRTQQASER